MGVHSKFLRVQKKLKYQTELYVKVSDEAHVHDGSAGEKQDLAAVSVDEVGGEDGGRDVDHSHQRCADDGLVKTREAEDRGGVEYH